MTNLVIENYHLVFGYSSKEYELGLAPEKFWIVNASSVIRRVLPKCFSCRRRHSPLCEQKMADLPLDRITSGAPPFTAVGIDCFGHLQVRRGRSLVKQYGVIFRGLRTALSAINLSSIIANDDINPDWHKWKDTFLLAVSDYIQTKRLKGRNPIQGIYKTEAETISLRRTKVKIFN